MACLIVYMLEGLCPFLEDMIFSILLAKEKMNSASVASLSIHELTSEKMTF